MPPGRARPVPRGHGRRALRSADQPAGPGRRNRAAGPGPAGFDLYPIVVDPRTFPNWKDAGPYLTILAGAAKAIDLGTPSGRDAVLAAIEQTGASHADTAALTTIILGVADAAARRELEALMASPKFRSTFVDGLLQQGEEKGLEKGLEIATKEMATQLLKKRFGRLPSWATKRLAAMSESEAKKLGLAVLDAKSLKDRKSVV